jgi:hypothetical protein
MREIKKRDFSVALVYQSVGIESVCFLRAWNLDVGGYLPTRTCSDKEVCNICVAIVP